jgi:hypothetical protein
MVARLVVVGMFVWLFGCSGMGMQPSPAAAALSGVDVVIRFNNAEIRSTSVSTMAIVTKGQPNGASYIECYFQTTAGQMGLHLTSADQRRVEALFQQIVTAASGSGRPFQITAYASSTYQSNGYTADLDSDLVYLILH